jgi:hypothetical protein
MFTRVSTCSATDDRFDLAFSHPQSKFFVGGQAGVDPGLCGAAKMDDCRQKEKGNQSQENADHQPFGSHSTLTGRESNSSKGSSRSGPDLK